MSLPPPSPDSGPGSSSDPLAATISSPTSRRRRGVAERRGSVRALAARDPAIGVGLASAERLEHAGCASIRSSPSARPRLQPARSWAPFPLPGALGNPSDRRRAPSSRPRRPCCSRSAPDSRASRPRCPGTELVLVGRRSEGRGGRSRRSSNFATTSRASGPLAASGLAAVPDVVPGSPGALGAGALVLFEAAAVGARRRRGRSGATKDGHQAERVLRMAVPLPRLSCGYRGRRRGGGLCARSSSSARLGPLWPPGPSTALTAAGCQPPG